MRHPPTELRHITSVPQKTGKVACDHSKYVFYHYHVMAMYQLDGIILGAHPQAVTGEMAPMAAQPS